MEAGEPRNDVLIGEMVDGRYRLVERIGEGATGLVYRAVAEPGSVAVAVKILRPEVASGEARRFEREAVAAGKVAHENLVGVRDFGALEDGRPYLVMDLVEGRSLAQEIAESPLAPARALAILAHVLRGLRQAHAAGVVHRDLKPDDIVLVDRGERRDVAVIVDFGTAALLGGAGAAAEQLTRAGIALGAPAYLAPERLDPDAAVDGRADLYSATCILFEMLTGRPPFGGDEVDGVELHARHRGAPRPRLGTAGGPGSTPGGAGEPDAAPDLDPPAALDAIVARGLAVDPARRFASADEYLVAVKAFLDGALDAAALAARPDPAPGQLAAPDPAQATTVFHGAPPPDALLAAAPAPEAVTPVAVEAAGGGARRAFAIAGGVLAVLVLVAMLLERRGEDGGAVTSAPTGSARDPMAGLIEAWRDDGLEPGRFASVAGDRFGGGDCMRGGVSGIDVVVCRHASAVLAKAARDRALGARPVPRAAITSADRLLVAHSPRRRDPRRTLTAVMRGFRRATAPRGDKVRTERTR
jgi:serine/threonine-protein kinase